MPTFSSADLASWAEGRWVVAPRAALTGFGTDTRALRAGDVFVAVRTERRDGHDFLGAARAQGAACALVERPVADDLPQIWTILKWGAIIGGALWGLSELRKRSRG